MANTRKLPVDEYKCKIRRPSVSEKDAWVFHPQAMTLTVAAVDYESGRAASGAMKRTMKGTVYTYDITMPPCTTAELKTALKQLQGAEQICTFFDPIKGKHRTARYYVGDRSLPVYNFANDIWNAWSFSMIEMTPRKDDAVLAGD